MSNYGEFTGNPELSKSYMYGKHWTNKKGFKLIKGKETYNHYFGGKSWDLPVCCNCNKSYHQIVTLDLTDPKLAEMGIVEAKELPLISCLNCSILWEEQVFKYDFENRRIEALEFRNDIKWIQEETLKIPTPLPKVAFHLEELDELDNPLNKKLYDDTVNKLGKEYMGRVLGAPVYLQNPIDYECPLCKSKMKYVAAVSSIQDSDNILPDIDFNFGETIIYFMYCKECELVKTVSQSD